MTKFIIPNVVLPKSFLLNDTISLMESSEIEYKKSFHINQYAKYRETICAFLNTTGGHIIYGVSNDCTISGCLLNELEKDNIVLFVDRLYAILIKTDGDHLHPDTLKVNFFEIAKNIYIVIISCYKEINCKYQFIAGDSWIRLNASNFRMNQPKLYTKEDLKQKVLVELIKINDTHSNEIKDTIIMISNILYTKEKQNNLIKKIFTKQYYLYFIMSIIFLLFFYIKICV
jgi:predicted HTH transcriptional regulator